MSKSKIKIWIDADACPKVIKEVLFKACAKQQLSLTLVANSYINIPMHPLFNFIQVDQGADVADTYIAENVNENDIVITADIPLADLIVKKNAIAINVRGELYTEENISERLSVRDFMQELRDSGVTTEGPAPFSQKDKINFTNSFNKIVTKLLK